MTWKRRSRRGKDGVAYTVQITSLRDAKNQEGRILQGLYRIRVIARWKENREPMELEAETLRFLNLFQPI